MSQGFKLTVNNQIVHEFNETRSPARLRRHLDEIDSMLDNGFELAGERVDKPTALQRKQYIAIHLFNAIDRQDDNLTRVMSTYFGSRFTEVNEIQITQSGEEFNLHMID